MDPSLKDEYEFIIGETTERPVQQQSTPLPSKSKKKLLVFGGIGVLTIFVILFSVLLFSGSGDKTTTSLVSVARQQAEIVRIAQLGVKKSDNAEIKAFAITVQTTVKSDNGSMLAYLKSNALPSDAKSIGASSTAAKTDDILTKAEQANQFDEAFEQVLRTEIASYQKKLQQVYELTESKNTKALISQFFKNTELLTSGENTD